ncbi:MAG: Gfo/Idh/MocA family oxidoreductase [Candidatus Bathyarchaeota archaeon]|jgi:predicted dehydrogenase|nr:Gfo/Idh/MocA family oxidoreductase [Candidatus Bathyarchaeota archaeon]
MKEKIKVAVVGFGKMGMLHAGILNALPGAKLVAVCEKSDLVQKFLKKAVRNVRVVDCVEKLSRLDLDAVYVTTPIASHFPVVKSLYESGVGCNLFVEKTLASNFDEAIKLCDLAQELGGVNMVGYMRRFSVTFMKAKDLLDEGVIGKPFSFKAYAYSSDFFEVKGNSKVKTPKVGVVRDLGCHALDLALWFFGGLRVEDAKVESVVNDGSMDSAQFRVKALGDVTGEFSVSWCVDGYRMPEVGFLVEGSEGSLSVNDDELTISLKDGKGRKWLKHDLGDQVGFWLGSPEYYREDARFIEAVIGRKSVEPCFETAAKVDRLIDEVLARAG